MQIISLRREKKNVRWCFSVAMVPTGIGKTGKMRKLFPVKEKSGSFEQTGKVREFYTKYWKNEGILSKILENLASFIFSLTF